MKLLATGAAGMLGGYLPAGAARTDIDTLDVTDRGAVAGAVAEHDPDVVFHLAAETNVDRCEQEPDRAYLTNALGTRNVALECARRDIVLVYVSTGAVFSGQKQDAYHEFDETDPANIYGRSKLAGERFVAALAPRSYIVRAGWMIGGGPTGEKKFIARMLERAEQTGKIVAVDDKWGSPTYARELMAGLLRLAETGAFGTYHMVNEGGACTRYDIAVLVNERLGRPFEVTRAASTEFPLPAPRGRSEVLENLVLRVSGWEWMSPWRDALADYLEREWEGWTPAVGAGPAEGDTFPQATGFGGAPARQAGSERGRRE
jgi:dTDP-4-dehydrorhamnose reductase